MIENFESEFLAFCKAKPADEEYKPYVYQHCALAQFVESKGFKPGSVGYGRSNETRKARNEFHFPKPIADAAINWGGQTATFGALVRRLEAVGVK